jgi:hypothetical protein
MLSAGDKAACSACTSRIATRLTCHAADVAYQICAVALAACLALGAMLAWLSLHLGVPTSINRRLPPLPQS